MANHPVWPAAERNKQPILDVLKRLLPSRGTVLELASATGQHVVHFAQSLPQLNFQPSDFDAEHLSTLEARVRDAQLSNLRPPLRIDATEESWPVTDIAAIYNANMIHISAWGVTLGLFRGSAKLLQQDAPLFTYGPYAVDGQHISDSNAAFDESLRSRNPEWGVRDLTAVEKVARAAGFRLEERVLMPANNFLVVWRRT